MGWLRRHRGLAEFGLVACCLLIYFLIRGGVVNRPAAAFQHAADVVDLERRFGFFWEPAWQRDIGGSLFWKTFWNDVYFWLHAPVIAAIAFWLYFRHRRTYTLIRNAFLISGAIGLIIFVNFPTAPPRLLEAHGVSVGFVDTILREYNRSRPDTPSFFVNEYAAMPSLHIGWNMLAAIALWMATKNPFARAFAVMMPVIMFAVIVLTANHYILDGFAGFGVMMLGLLIAVAGRWVVLRIYSPNSKAAREKGWVPWLYWLCGVADREQAHQVPERQAA